MKYKITIEEITEAQDPKDNKSEIIYQQVVSTLAVDKVSEVVNS